LAHMINGPCIKIYLNDSVVAGKPIVAQLLKKFTPSYAT
jgi:hypothetical protein